MAESIRKRIVFPPGKQREYLTAAQAGLRYDNTAMARLLGISIRTWTDWKRERFTVDSQSTQILTNATRIPLPNTVEVKEAFWYIQKAARLGGQALIDKYGRVGGDPEKRLQKWRLWWNNNKKTGYGLSHPKVVNLPEKSEQLAEFFGIMLGDGGMTQNQVFITLHAKDDHEFGIFVSKMILDLFGITPSVQYRTSGQVVILKVSRTMLVQYLHARGLIIGNKVKQMVDIPSWIKANTSYQIACLRGLVDTDGCVFNHSYTVNGKTYTYPKICFTSASRPLRNSVFKSLRGLGFKPRMSQNRDVRLDGQKDVKDYFRIINSHNPKHLNKLIK